MEKSFVQYIQGFFAWVIIGIIYGIGGNIEDGKINIQRSNDEGINWDNPAQISFYPEHICSNDDFFEIEKNDIISSWRAIGNLFSDN